jgi:hypothetical protein
VDLQQIHSRLKSMNSQSVVSDDLLMNHMLGNLPKVNEQVADVLARDATKTIVSISDSLQEKFERMKVAGKIVVPEKGLVDPRCSSVIAIVVERRDTSRLNVSKSIMLLYLVKLSRPDLSNAVRELSKVMDGATMDHMDLML